MKKICSRKKGAEIIEYILILGIILILGGVATLIIQNAFNDAKDGDLTTTASA